MRVQTQKMFHRCTTTSFSLCMLGVMLVALSIGCRGDISAEPPVHLFQNMDQQERFEAQERNPYFDDNRAMRLPVEGTIARGQLRADDHLHRGKINGVYAEDLPNGPDGKPMMVVQPTTPTDIERNTEFLNRGQERYAIFCTPCHDSAGSGKGIVTERAVRDNPNAPKPPDFQEERVLAMPVGQLYDVIANGARNMPPYAQQIPVRDRWAIATYVRALQLTGRARLDQIPTDRAAEKRWEIR